MQRDVNLPNVLESCQRDIPNVSVLAIPSSVNELVPQLAEVVLELWQSIPCVEFTHGFQRPAGRAFDVNLIVLPYFGTSLEGLPNDVDKVGEKDAIAVGEITSKNRCGCFDLASYELDPTIVASLYLDTRDNDSDDTLRIIGSYRVVYPAPAL